MCEAMCGSMDTGPVLCMWGCLAAWRQELSYVCGDVWQHGDRACPMCGGMCGIMETGPVLCLVGCVAAWTEGLSYV